MIRFLVGELTTGRKIIPLPASEGSWEIRRNRSGSISCDMVLSSRGVKPGVGGLLPSLDLLPGEDLFPSEGVRSKNRDLDLRQNAAVGRSFLAIAEGDRILAAGPIWEHNYNDDTRRLSIEAEGMWSLLNRRYILPAAVETLPLLITEGSDAGQPNPAVSTIFSGASWPAIVRGILEQGFTRAGGELPIVFGDDGAGAHDKSYDAASFKSQGEAIGDLTELLDGPEVEFRPFFTSDGTAVEWRAMVGDDAQPEIASIGKPHLFDFSVAKRSVRRLRVRSSAREMTSEAWGTGGRQAAVALVSRAASTALEDAGYPRLESLSNAHSTVELQSTLDGYTAADLQLGSGPTEWWEWETNIDQVPKLSSLWLGDYCTAVTRGNAYLPDGAYRRRIAAMSGTLRSRWVRVVTDEVTA